jgi:hypothetical protein
VTLCVQTSRHDSLSGDFLTAGVHSDVNGDTALAFVRDRHTFADQDLSRIKDQQYFLSQVLKTVTSAGTLANPLKVNAFLSAATDSLTVDNQLGIGGLRTLAGRLRHLDPAHVTFTTLPITNAAWFPPGGGGQEAVELDQSATRALFASLKQAPKKSSPSTTAAPAPTVPPSQVQVVVENGTATSGLAGRSSTALRAAGFDVTSIGNAATDTVSQTTIRYAAAEAGPARTLAAAVPGATLVEDPTLSGAVVLTLGADYRGVGAGSPAATPTTTGATPTTTPASALTCAP